MNFETDKWSKWKTLIKPRRFKSKFRRKTGTVFVLEIVEPVLFGIAAIYGIFISSHHHQLRKSSLTVIVITIITILYTIYVFTYVGWGFFNWNSALKCNSATFPMIEAYSLQCFIVYSFTNLHITSLPFSLFTSLVSPQCYYCRWLVRKLIASGSWCWMTQYLGK